MLSRPPKIIIRILFSFLAFASFNVLVSGFSLADLSLTQSLKSVWQKATHVFAEEVPQKPDSIRGIYLTASTFASPHGNVLITKLLEIGGNAVTIDIQAGSGLLAFRPQDEYLKKINPGSDLLVDLTERVKKLHDQGLYVIARHVVFSQPYITSRKPEWRVKKKQSGYYYQRQWLDPSLLDVQNYNLKVMREVADLGFDEIQFDYIRFPAADHRYLNYAYDETKFTRADIILDFLRRAKAIAIEKKIQLSADVYGGIVWGNVDWAIVGQNPAEMAKIVDAIYPMTYPSHFGNGYYGHPNTHNAPYSIVNDSIDLFIKAANGNAEIRPWVQGFPLKVNRFGSWFMEEQINAAFDAGVNDFMIWSPGNVYTLSWPSFALKPKAPAALAEIPAAVKP